MKLSFEELAKKFTPAPTYRVTVMWDYMEETIANWQDKSTGPNSALDLNPDFQREHVWTTDQQIQYVEYILSGGMSGKEIYFNCVGWMRSYVGPFVIVDGKQRLQAVRRFMANEIPIFGDNYRKDIEGRLRLNASFTFAVNDLKTRADVLKWYLEMNTGGTPHTEEEIQKAKDLLAMCS